MERRLLLEVYEAVGVVRDVQPGGCPYDMFDFATGWGVRQLIVHWAGSQSVMRSPRWAHVRGTSPRGGIRRVEGVGTRRRARGAGTNPWRDPGE